MANGEVTTGKVIALIRALSTSSTSSATYTVTDALIIGAATTSGVRLDLESGTLAVREGDDSAYAPLTAGFIKGSAFGTPGVGTSAQFLPGVLAVSGNVYSSTTRINSVDLASSALTSGASYTFTNALPAGAFVLGVTSSINTTVTGPTSVQVGDGTDADRYGIFSTLTAGQFLNLSSSTADPTGWQAANGNVVLTAVGGNFTSGVMRITVHYLSATYPIP